MPRAKISAPAVPEYYPAEDETDKFSFRPDFSALIYYISIVAVFLFLTVRVYEKRRWD